MDALDDTGLDLDAVAASLARAFDLCLGRKPEPDGELSVGWLAAARVGVATFGEGDDDVTLSFTQVATLMHRAFSRAAGDFDDDPPQLADCPPPVKVAWVAAARHCANVCQFEPADARQIERHEAQIADWARKQLAPTPA